MLSDDGFYCFGVGANCLRFATHVNCSPLEKTETAALARPRLARGGAWDLTRSEAYFDTVIRRRKSLRGAVKVNSPGGATGNGSTVMFQVSMASTL